ncbi:restriction endonuclease subunit S [Campylobacter vulpis]|uniref:restriction endonuclease subunit S n=1 Tax=Campylobacter vulpis TaxID=1655500 RepID=UPI001BD0A94F|nr:restriction endonuclease subunit S [Campylobacter vulpis]MBS4269282.1 restriction endonuclease subunit S [Campylobacter vulpis]
MKKHTQSPYESSKVSYKPSGIEWLGEIPQSWEIKKCKFFFIIQNTIVGDLWNKTKLLSLTLNGVVERDINNPEGKFPSDFSTYQLVKRGNLVFCLFDVEETPRAIGLSQIDGMITSVYTVIKVVNQNERFLAYLFISLDNGKNLSFLYRGLRKTISKEDLLNLKIPLPPLQEQKEIAEFLDSKCEKIQNYIDKKQKLITLLQEKKQALINQAVTKGLNPNIESKNSGIEYLGEIPQHWEVRRVATLGKFFKGSNISKNDLQDSGVSVVLYGDIYTKYEIKTKQFQSKIAENFAKDKTQILCGDLLFSGSGETKEDIGKCICYLGNEKAYVGGDVIVLRQMGQDSLFLSYVLNSDYIKYQKAVISKGEIIIHIYASNLRDLKIPLPPLHEQKEIAEFLDSKVAQIDSVIEKTKKQIELIKEYKNTLINEAVCGRVACSRDFSPTAQNDKRAGLR